MIECLLSHYQAKEILAAHKAGHPTARTSLDLNLTHTTLLLTSNGIQIDQLELTYEELQKIAKTETTCFRINIEHPRSNTQDLPIEKIQIFSEHTQRFYSLFPSQSAPTMMVSGFPMHRIKNTDPMQDTKNKINAIGKLKGKVLDTTMGLGYTAIEASKHATVTTIELDPAVLEICRNNPWSQLLFPPLLLPGRRGGAGGEVNPIQILIGDSEELIKEFPNETFDAIIHDPPTFKLAGQLYSADFYRELKRVLKRKGKLFHYLGDPNTTQGKTVTEGAIRRLKESGFKEVVRRSEAFGVVATYG